MVKIVLEVDRLAIAYIMQLRQIKDFGISEEKWNNLFRGIYGEKDQLLVKEIQTGLEKEYMSAEKLKGTVAKQWRQHEKKVLNWLKELTKVDFKTPTVKVCIVPFTAGRTPFRDIPLIIVGEIRRGWGHPETLAHELTHVLFNQNFCFRSEAEHPYVQLIEEEIAVRLGVRARYFDYEVPSFAGWVHKAQKIEKIWRHYLRHIDDFRDISQLIEENEEKDKSP
jgi:hypothetical protein